MYSRQEKIEKLRSLIDQAERLSQETNDIEWKSELHRSIGVFKRMLKQVEEEAIHEE